MRLQNSNEEVLTEEQAATLLQLCTRTLRKLRNLGQIPFAKVAGQIRYRRSELLAWLSAGGTSQFKGNA